MSTLPAPVPGPTAPARRRRIGPVVIAAGLVTVLVAGVWGLLAPRGGEHDDHPGIGEVVGYESGTFVVDAAYDVDLSAPMSGPGMTMGPSSGVPEIPDGYRWVTVDLTIRTALDEVVFLDPDAFVAGEADAQAGSPPVTVDDGADALPPGTEVSRSFTYEVPEDAQLLELWAPGSQVPVMLPLGDAPPPHQH